MKALFKLLNDFTSKIEEVNANLDIYSRVRSAMREPELAFHTEQCAINASIEIAESKIKTEKYMSQSEEHKQRFIEAFEDLQKARGQENEEETKVTFTIHDFLAPPSDPNPEINKSIETAFQKLVKERDEYFGRIRHRLQNNERLRELAKYQLHEFGCDKYWDEIFLLPVGSFVK